MSSENKGMHMKNVVIGKAEVSRLCMGGNPFSGFSHQSDERSKEMVRFYTPEKIKETLFKAEQASVNIVCAYGRPRIWNHERLLGRRGVDPVVCTG